MDDPIQFVDTHFHAFHMIKKGIILEDLFEDLQNSGFVGGLDIGVDPDDVAPRYSMLKKYGGIRLSAGMYPAFALEKDRTAKLRTLRNSIEEFSVSAVGEIGIDCFHDFGPPEMQQSLLTECLEIANQYRLPVIIHNREADEFVYESLSKTIPRAGGIIHCFSSTKEWAEKFAELGMYISFAGNVTFKKAEELRNAVHSVPRHRLLIETDAPYLSPHPERGKVNNPGRILHTYRFIAELLGVELPALTEKVRINFFTLMGNAEKT